MTAPQESEAEQFRAEISMARARSAREINLLRFLAVSLFLVLSLALGVGVGLPRWQGSLPLFAVYWVLAAAALEGSRRSQRVSRVASLAIPCVDMPMVFLLQWQSLANVPDPRATAAFSVAIFVGLMILAALALEARQNIAAGVIATGLQLSLLYLTDAGLGLTLSSIVLLGLIAMLSGYARVRVFALAHGIAAEHVRRSHLSRYFSPDVVDAIESPDLDRGRRREVSILFSDLRGFTAMSEKLESQQVVDLLTDYQERMVRAIFEHGGTLDKFIGDGIMAYFGSLDEQENSAESAVRCSVSMHQALMGLNRERAQRGEPALRMGVGVHTGAVILGNIGSPERREYTAIGDAVNLSSRIEGLTKKLGEPILVSAATRRCVGDAMSFVKGGEVEVQGKSEPVEVFMPVAQQRIESGPVQDREA
jgi:adenylate cyclase